MVRTRPLALVEGDSFTGTTIVNPSRRRLIYRGPGKANPRPQAPVRPADVCVNQGLSNPAVQRDLLPDTTLVTLTTTFQNWDSLFHPFEIPGGSDGKASARSAGDPSSVPDSGRSPGEGNGNPLQYSCLENPMDGWAWRAAAHGVTEWDTTERRHCHFLFHPFTWVIVSNTDRRLVPPLACDLENTFCNGKQNKSNLSLTAKDSDKKRP